jgi:hypothetical protein
VPQLKALLVPYPAEEMTRWPVRARVGNVWNNDPRLIEPIAANEPACTARRAVPHIGARGHHRATKAATGILKWTRICGADEWAHDPFRDARRAC